MVFLKYYYYECVCWVSFDLFSCIDEKICWSLYTFVVYFDYLVVFCLHSEILCPYLRQ